MNSDQATDRSPRSLVGRRWTRAALVPVLLAGALTSSVPAAHAKSAAKGEAGAKSAGGPAQVAPGQAKKVQPNGRDAVHTAAVAARAAAGQDKKAKDTRSRADAQPRETAAATSAARGAGKDEPARAQAAAATPTAAAPAAVVPIASPQPQPAPAPAPAAAPATASVAPQQAASSTRSSGTAAAAARRRARARRASAARGTAQAAPVRVSAVPTALTAPAGASQPKQRAASAGSSEGERSPLTRTVTRTVTRVLEVIPDQVRIALGALALLGLLLGAAAAVQTVRSRRLVRQRRLLLADVGLLQSALLPDLPEQIGGARVTAAYRPAAGLAAGGDFYDAFELPGGRTGVIVGDVAGHGRDAVPLTALVRYNLRAYLEAGLTPRATLDVASNVLAPQLGGRQVTIVVAIFDPGTGRLTYACAGHWPPLLLGTTATLVTACSSPPLGAGVATGRRQTTVALAPGAAACFVTDGLEDVTTAPGRRLGRHGVGEELQAIGADGDAADLLDRVVRRSDAQTDDMTACIITALPGGAEHWSVQLEELEVDAAMLSGGWVEQFLVACGAAEPQIERALHEAHEMVGLAGTAIIEARIGEQLLEIRVDPPAAVSLPIARRRMPAAGLEATG